MKFQTVLLAITFLASQNADAGQLRACSDQSRRIDDSLRKSSSATSDLSRSLYDLGQLSSALESGAQTLGSGSSSIDLRREFEPLLARVESTVRRAKDIVASAMADFNDMPNHGSYAYTLAGIAAGKLEGGKQVSTDAVNDTNVVKNKVRELHSKLANGSQAQTVKDKIRNAVQNTSGIDSSITSLEELRRVSTLTNEYTSYCSNQSVDVCYGYRNELRRSGDRLYEDHRDLTASSDDLRRLRYQIQDLASAIKVGASVDLNGALLPLIESTIVSQMQDAWNNFHISAEHSKKAETASSGVLFGQLINIAVPAAQKADRLSDNAIRGSSETRSAIGQIQSQIGNPTGGTSASDLRQVARTTLTARDRLSDLVRRLGSTSSFGKGDIGTASTALETHRRSCEL